MKIRSELFPKSCANCDARYSKFEEPFRPRKTCAMQSTICYFIHCSWSVHFRQFQNPGAVPTGACREPYVSEKVKADTWSETLSSFLFQDGVISKASIVGHQLASSMHHLFKTKISCQISPKPGRLLPFCLCLRNSLCIILLDLCNRLISVVFHHSLLFEIFYLSYAFRISIPSF